MFLRSGEMRIPLPKKGGFSSCDNWRGINLLDVMGKVLQRFFGNIYGQLWRRRSLIYSVHGFWCNCGCIDMIFVHVN